MTYSLLFYKNIVSCTNKCVIEPLIKTIMTRWPYIQFYKIHDSKYGKKQQEGTISESLTDKWDNYSRGVWLLLPELEEELHTQWPINGILPLTWENSSQTLIGIKMETNRLCDKECCPPLRSSKIKSLAAVIHWPAIHSGKKSWKLSGLHFVLWENWQNLPSHTWIFQETFLWTQFPASVHA